MFIYRVANKTFSALFQSQKDAEKYSAEIATGSNGLWNIEKVFVIDDSEGKEK